jgi:hypothetical protein
VNEEGWQPLRPPGRSSGQGGPSLVASPFVRLARVHAFAAGSDAAVAVALAGSIFFSISPDAARWRVALYLALTMAPFAVVTPLIGPLIDRLSGGRKAMIVTTTLGRAVIAFFMIRHIETLWLFPLAFGYLVLQKGYAVAKSAVVPRYVHTEADLVDANSRLALISAVISLFGAAIGGGFSLIGGSGWAAGVAMVGFGIATLLAFKLPGIQIAAAPPEPLEKLELRSVTILLAGSAIAVLRGAVGFVTFLLAFEFRGGQESLDVSADGAAVGGVTATLRGIDIQGDPAAPVWHFGMVILAAGMGALFGARLAPRLRTRLSEETMITGVLAGTAAAAVLAALVGGLFGATVLSFVIASGAGAGKLTFDALVQRDAPDANYGRSFARFEARFQIAWVVGAFIPTVVPLGTAIGSAMVAIAIGFALASYLLGRAGRRPPLRPRFGPSLRIRFRRQVPGDLDEHGPGEVATPGSGGDTGSDATLLLGTPSDEDATTPVEIMGEPDTPLPPESGGVPPAPWWPDPTAPNVSSVEGVEVDEPGPESSLPPITEPADDTSEPTTDRPLEPDDEASDWRE